MTKLHIERQGAAVISHAVVVYQSDAVVLIDLSMNTKRTAVGCLMEVDGVPGLSITTHEGSVHLHPIETGWTDITFPDWHGWDIYSAMGGKWAVRIALYHPERAQAQQKGPAS